MHRGKGAEARAREHASPAARLLRRDLV